MSSSVSRNAIKDDQKATPNRHYYSYCGAVSGIVTRIFVQPLDVIKIRFQLQVEPITQVSSVIGTHVPKYSGIAHAVRTICKEEHITALWKGHVPAQVLSVLYGAVQFATFEASTQFCWNVVPHHSFTQWKPAIHFLCGGFAGCSASVVCQPIDVLRTRLVAQGEPKIYISSLDAVKKMYIGEGFTAFYKGLTPTLFQIFPQTGLQFGFYTCFKTLWRMFLPSEMKWSKLFGESVVCGALAGVCSKTLVYPFDMVKKRFQVQGFEQARSQFGQTHYYSGLVHCFKTIINEEGKFAFFKGLSPSLIKAALSTALIFATYEVCMKQMKKETDLS